MGLQNQPPKRINTATMLSNLQMKLSSVETKIRINEQNLLNDRQHSQLINKNLLELKKEVRERLDKASQENRELSTRVDELSKRVEELGKGIRMQKPAAQQVQVVNLKKPQMSAKQASSILDNILKGKAPTK